MHASEVADPEPVAFGPGRVRRRCWGGVAVLLAGGVAAYVLLVPRTFLFVLVALFPLAPAVIGGIAGRVRPPTVVERDGIRCSAMSLVPVPRRELVPWPVIARIGVKSWGLRTFAVLRLTDGSLIRLRHPLGWRGGRRVHEAVAFMRQRHLAACDGTLPRVDGVPLPWRRIRVWVWPLALALPVVSLAGLAMYIRADLQGLKVPDDVVACEQVPRQAAVRVLPEGGVQGNGNRQACRWGTARPWENGTWIDFHITAWSRDDSRRSYQETLKAMRAAGRAPHLLREGEAYTVAWQDSWGFTAQGRAHVRGYLVMVALHSRRTASAAETERQAGEVLRAVAEKLAERA
ncbi:hypothetical protein ACFVH6_15240 [Spirillospora sp. NPDC127200]